jgi:hypothetical protein
LQINVAYVGVPTSRNQMKARGFGLVHNLIRKERKNHLIQDVNQRKLGCQNTWMQKKMVLEHKLFDNIPLNI